MKWLYHILTFSFSFSFCKLWLTGKRFCFQRITISEILEDEWFKKDYKTPQFEKEEDVNLDDVDAVFNDSKVRNFSHVFLLLVTKKSVLVNCNAYITEISWLQTRQFQVNFFLLKSRQQKVSGQKRKILAMGKQRCFLRFASNWILFYQKELSAISAKWFVDSQDCLVTEKKVKPVSMNAFELISRSQSFNLENLFEKQSVRITSFILLFLTNLFLV